MRRIGCSPIGSQWPYRRAPAYAGLIGALACAFAEAHAAEAPPDWVSCQGRAGKIYGVGARRRQDGFRPFEEKMKHLAWEGKPPGFKVDVVRRFRKR